MLYGQAAWQSYIEDKLPVLPATSFNTQGITADGIPIVFVTAYAGRYDKATLIKAGGDDLITKPVDPTRLSLCISRLIVRRTPW